jgi:SAM-dependent methyltransferase
MTTLQASRYFAQDVALEIESERLLSFQAALDPLTRRRLDFVGVGPGWQCLEVGAGRGSVARWLGQVVAPRGRVVATDIDLRMLTHVEGPYVQLREHDILTDDLEQDTYNLVHCRHVLMHLPDPQRALEKMVASLCPGGWLVVEEPMFTEPLFVTREHLAAGAVERVYAALREHLAQFMDLGFGEKVVAMVAELGLEEFFAEQTRLYAPGGHAGPVTNMLTWEMFREPLLESGLVAPDDMDVASAAMQDPSFIGSGAHQFGVFGRKALA